APVHLTVIDWSCGVATLMVGCAVTDSMLPAPCAGSPSAPETRTAGPAAPGAGRLATASVGGVPTARAVRTASMVLTASQRRARCAWPARDMIMLIIWSYPRLTADARQGLTASWGQTIGQMGCSR